MNLSKSDYILGKSCLTKLYYKKNKYTSSDDTNEYMQYLAEGGYIISKLATLYYPDGIIINTENLDHAIARTKEYLDNDQCILFEATIHAGDKIVAVDILVKEGDTINIIEVKSKGYSSEKGLTEFKDQIEDVAFQKLVLAEAFPNAIINTYLFVPNKDKRTKIDNLNSMFYINNRKIQNGFKSFDVTFTGDVNKIIEDDLMIKIDISDEVNQFLGEVKSNSEKFINSLLANAKPAPELSKKCFICEYNVKEGKSGYGECWENHLLPDHHLKYVYQFSRKVAYIDDAIKNKSLSMFYIPLDILTGSYRNRQIIQIENTRTGSEWVSNKLRKILDDFEYPLHFIDFETVVTALPYHMNMKPYEMSAFQWSCHSIMKHGDEPIHNEWINTEPEFPSFKFANSLKDHIGYSGTVLMWATHENTTLKNILSQMEEYLYPDKELENWLNYIIRFDKGESPLVDMNKLTLENYFHPLMKGKTSIKKTLPAVLSSNISARTERWLKEFGSSINLYSQDSQGKIENPYKNLPDIDINDQAVNVSDGTGAMIAYNEMLYRKFKDTEISKHYEKSLLNYCKLDTLAMVIIWEHWKQLINKS